VSEAPLQYAPPDEQKRSALPLVLVIGGVGVLFVAGIAAFMLLRSSQAPTPVNVPAAGPSPAAAAATPTAPQPVLLGKPDLSESSDDMIAILNKGRDKFHEARHGKVIDVTGDITDIRLDLTNRRFVALSGGVERTLGVRCFFAETNLFQIDELKRGQRVVIRGRYETVEPDIVLLDCGVVRTGE
jgi:hypothetical protein